MAIITWLVIIGGAAFLIWYGYGLLAKKPEEAGGAAPQEMASCHLCRRSFPISEMVNRDKMAGFINYFCGDCVESLYAEYIGKFRDNTSGPGLDPRKSISRN